MRTEDPCFPMSSQASIRSSRVLIFILASTSASCLLGVTSSQMGRSFFFRADANPSSVSDAPVPEIITGSTISGISWSSSMSATVPTISAL